LLLVAHVEVVEEDLLPLPVELLQLLVVLLASKAAFLKVATVVVDVVVEALEASVDVEAFVDAAAVVVLVDAAVVEDAALRRRLPGSP
jgi:hypothetical protein